MDGLIYQSLASRSRNFTASLELDNQHRRMLEAVVGLSGELSEVTEPIKKYIFHDKALDKEKVLDEASDCLWYLDELLQSVGYTLEDALKHNVIKLEKRHKLVPQVE